MLIETPVSTTRFLVYLQVYMKKLSRYSTYADMKISEFQRISEFRPLPKVDYTSLETPIVAEADRLDVIEEVGSLEEERSALESLMAQFTSATDFAETVAFNEEPEFTPVSDLGISSDEWFVSDSSSEVLPEEEVVDSDFYMFLELEDSEDSDNEGTSVEEDDFSDWDKDDEEPDGSEEDLDGWEEDDEEGSEESDDLEEEPDDFEEDFESWDEDDEEGSEDFSGWDDDDSESDFEVSSDEEELEVEDDLSGWEDDEELEEQVSVSTPTVDSASVSEPTVAELYTLIFNSSYIPRRPAFKYVPKARVSKPKAPISRPKVKMPELHVQPPTPPVQADTVGDKFVRLESEDVVAYARRLVRVSEDVAIKYFSPKEIEQALKAGKIMRRRGVLIFAHN